MFAGIPLGNFVKKKRLDPQENRKEAAKIAIVSGIASGAFGFQIILGVGLPLLFMAFIPGLEFYNQFGYEICQGFNGGHGMAGAIGSLLMEGGASYWELSQGFLTTFATIGLLGGILLGVMIINRAAAKGKRPFERIRLSPDRRYLWIYKGNKQAGTNGTGDHPKCCH
ncbi:hypothetical protein M5E89_01015 [Acidaminococcus intestini]|nr:hypothetical protein M5E89_01015 [Acidaminococcus intestini]